VETSDDLVDHRGDRGLSPEEQTYRVAVINGAPHSERGRVITERDRELPLDVQVIDRVSISLEMLRRKAYRRGG
jgi:hypothetical protein